MVRVHLKRDKVMKNISKIVKGLWGLDYKETTRYITDNFDENFFETFMAQKGIEKIYRNALLVDKEKRAVIMLLQTIMKNHAEEIQNTYIFLQNVIPIEEKILIRIRTVISTKFPDSLACFYYCTGMYIQEHPEMIGLARSVLIDVAKKCLSDDLASINYRLSISLANIYIKAKEYYEEIYKEAVKYGALVEKYDAISFDSEYINSVCVVKSKPFITFKLRDYDFEYGIQCGVYYHNCIVRQRYKETPGVIHTYYKCLVCRRSFFEDIDKDLVEELLNRQFSNMNQTDLFFFFTGDFQSYILSMISYIYTKFLMLCTHSTHMIERITKEEIRRDMMWGGIISDDDFELCYSSLVLNKNFLSHFSVVEGDILIGKWQWDLDVSIVEIAKSVALDSRSSKKAGENADNFGKRIYEKVVKGLLVDSGWKVIQHSVKLRNNKKIITDVDLLAYKNGNVLVGQIKVANCGRKRYDIWKTKQVINNAVEQIKICMEKFEDENLMYSILKKEKIVSDRTEIRKIIPVVITSSSYFIGMSAKSCVPILSWDMFYQVICYIEETNEYEELSAYFNNLESLYDFPISKEFGISVIEQDEYRIEYEEYEE